MEDEFLIKKTVILNNSFARIESNGLKCQKTRDGTTGYKASV